MEKRLTSSSEAPSAFKVFYNFLAVGIPSFTIDYLIDFGNVRVGLHQQRFKDTAVIQDFSFELRVFFWPLSRLSRVLTHFIEVSLFLSGFLRCLFQMFEPAILLQGIPPLLLLLDAYGVYKIVFPFGSLLSST